jgi:hypothetical protein
MKLRKKVPYYFALIFLTIAASLILGFLSFGGMLALIPFLMWPAYVVFGFSVVYDMEIFFQHIKGTLNKLFFSRDYLKNELANDYLRKYFPNTEATDCPEFFKEYSELLKSLKKHKKLLKKSSKAFETEYEEEIERLERELKRKQKWFAEQLNSEDTDDTNTAYAQEIQNWLKKTRAKKSPEDSIQAEFQRVLTNKSDYFKLALLFSVLTAIVATVGNSYLILHTISEVALLAAIPAFSSPFFVIPLAIFTGIAWASLTYNSLTNLIKNDTLYKIKKDFLKLVDKKEWVKLAFYILITLIIIGLALLIPILEAGTWFTIVQEAPNILTNIGHSMIMLGEAIRMSAAVLVAVFMGLSTLCFSLDNLYETMNIFQIHFNSLTTFVNESINSLMESIEKGTVLESLGNKITETWNDWLKDKNIVQLFNPFRFINKIVFPAICGSCFAIHAATIALIADKFPGMKKSTSFGTSFGDELAQDLHYYFPVDPPKKGTHFQQLLRKQLKGEGCGHNHNEDIPSKILSFAYELTLFPFLEAVWDWAFSHLNGLTDTSRADLVLSFEVAWENRTTGAKAKKHAHSHGHKKIKEEVEPIQGNLENPQINCDAKKKPPQKVALGKEWIREHLLYKINNYKKYNFTDLTNNAVIPLLELEEDLKKTSLSFAEKKVLSKLTKTLTSTKAKYGTPDLSFFSFFQTEEREKQSACEFLDKLVKEIEGLAPAACA